MIRLIPSVLGVIVAAGMIYYLINSDILGDLEISSIRWGFVVLMVLVRSVTWYLSGISLSFFVKEKDISLDFTETFGLTTASLLINKITPVAGAMVVKSGYLKKRYNYALSNYMALMVANSLINYFVSGLLGLIVISLISILPGFRVAWEGIPIMAAVLILPVVIILLPLDRLNLKEKNRITRWVNLAVSGWNDIRSNQRLLVKQVLIVIAIIASRVVSYIIAPLSLGQNTPILGLIFISILTNVTRVTPIRDFFGFTEFVSGLGTQMTGIGIEAGITAAVAFRASSIIASLIFGSIFFFILSRRLGESLIKSAENS